jgi:DNA polymerase III gamma/tau subunit
MVGQTDQDSIKIDEIRQLLQRAGLKAYEAKTKVFIIRTIERMTADAANALLKTLEEPAPNTLMILTTVVPEACLDTIKSRCHTVRFFALEERLPPDRDRVLDLFLSRRLEAEYLKSLAEDKHRATQAMVILLSWMRDVLLYKAGINQRQLVYRDRGEALKKMASRSMEDLTAVTGQIVRTKKLMDEHLNIKMSLVLLGERIWGN